VSHVYLVGFMGSGKSTVGRILSEKLAVPLVDLDARIEDEAGRCVSEIFAEEGEPVFRSREHDALLKMEGEESSVVACGGGVILSDENRAFLKRTGVVIYLGITAAEALARVGGAETRPLLAGDSGAMAATLLQARETLYRAVADVSIDTVGKTPDQVANEALAFIEDRWDG